MLTQDQDSCTLLREDSEMDKQQIEEAVRAGYKVVAPANPDHIICDPELRTRFLEAVRLVLGPEVSEYDLLRRLLIMRKTRKL